MFRASLVRVPAPAGPMCTTSVAQQANTGSHPLEGLGIAADDGGERALVGAHEPAAHRHVEHGDALLGGGGGQLLRGLGPDGGVDGDDGARARRW